MADADNTSNELMDQLRAAIGTQYSIDRMLGQGGMGAVFLARDLTLDRQVAIKVINPDVATNATVRDRFLMEARSVAKLRHPNTVSVYAAGQSNGLLYFVMEFVPGESLRDLLAREGIVETERAEHILRGIALALDNAHANDMVHRDVKPENILLDKDSGRAMLTDFGVARALEKDGGVTQTGMILGSPRYMSPEQASGDRSIDGRSDLYCLALVGYEMFSGQAAVQSSTPSGFLVKHVTEVPPPLATKAASIPEHIAAAIDHGLIKDPAQRWQTGKAFAEALSGHALTPTGEMRGMSAPRVASAAKKKKRLIAGATAAIAAGVAAFVAIAGARPVGRAYLVAPFEIQSADQSIAWLRDGSVNMLTLTLGQWGDLQVVDYERTLSLLDKAGISSTGRVSLDDVLRVARKASAGRVVTGQIQTIHDSLFVTAKLYDVKSGKSTNQARDSADVKADPRPVFDRLATKLLQIAGGPTTTVELAKATTSSIEAYRAYLNGIRLLNHWDLQGADTAFARAIDIDSSFALAYHKRSLELGWGEGAARPEYMAGADRAFDLRGRLPARERAMVEGHYHLAHALQANGAQDTANANVEFSASIKAYEDLFARGDTLVAEAWYGIADAYYHGRIGSLPMKTLVDYTTKALRGMNKAIAIDSSFHLAYSHLINIYNAAGQNSNILVSGDSAFGIVEEADVKRLGGPIAVQRYRDSARVRGTAISRAWVQADPNSGMAYLQLGQSLFVQGHLDSAITVMQSSLQRPLAQAPAARAALLAFQAQQMDPGAGATVRYMLDKFTRDSMREVPSGQRIATEGDLMVHAATAGRSSDVERAGKLFVLTDSVMPGNNAPTDRIVQFNSMALRVAMGEPVTPDMKRAVLAANKAISQLPPAVQLQARSTMTSVPYVLYLASRDTVFSNIMNAAAGGAPLTELEALSALSRGDSAAARKIAETFTTPDSIVRGKLRFSMGGLRSIARAQVLEELGLKRQAAELYDVMKGELLTKSGYVEPGFVVWVRSLHAKARLWRDLGETDKAVAAYNDFINRWKDADGVAAKEVAQAKQELAAMRDAPKR